MGSYQEGWQELHYGGRGKGKLTLSLLKGNVAKENDGEPLPPGCINFPSTGHIEKKK